MRWPGKIKPGSIIDYTISHLDWFPTIADIAKAKIPNDKIVRGRSLLPLLGGKKVMAWNNDFYGEYSMQQYSQADMRCYRTPDWKLIKDFKDPSRDELYNLKNDPHEANNLIHKDDKVSNAIKKSLTEKILLNMRLVKDELLQKIPGKI